MSRNYDDLSVLLIHPGRLRLHTAAELIDMQGLKKVIIVEGEATEVAIKALIEGDNAAE